jgi:hypothetical protein
VDLGRNVTVRFSRCFRLTITRGDPLDGHSGSVLLARRGAAVVACGLVFAGNRGSILATSLPETLRALSRRRASADGSEEDVSIPFGR